MLSVSLISFIYVWNMQLAVFKHFSDQHTMWKCLSFVIVRVLNFPLHVFVIGYHN